MNDRAIFISHSSMDDVFVKELRVALESSGLTVWADSRNLRGGEKLAQEVEEAIEQARQFIAVISVNTINSPWVRKEIAKALEVERRRSNEEYRVVPLLLPGVEPSALQLWFNEEPVGIRVETGVGGLSEALPQILAAIGERLPTDRQPVRSAPSPPIEELILKLYRLRIETEDGKRLVQAAAQLTYNPADKATREVESRPFIFTAPIGVIEAEDLRWYLEEYFVWPVGVFKGRAERIESQLPKWGQQLYQVTLASQAAQEAVTAWQQHGNDSERRFSVFVDSELPDGSSEKEMATAKEAAAELLSLPWELLHDGRGFLFHGKYPIRVRRRLPNRYPQRVRQTQLPVRILLVSPRPEDARTGYIDHRISAKPLVEAVESLGELAKVSVLTPPTFPALEEALHKAADAGEPFDVVHFDGHGIYDRKLGLGGLCFEDPNDTQKLESRAVQLVHAERLAEVIRDHRIPLVFLEACQTAKAEVNPTASVAAKLLEEGVISVVAMSHSILVETAHRFVKAFYRELARGKRVGASMLAGQRELHGDDYRGKRLGVGELRLQDWFVPVLYQEELDPQIIAKSQPEEVQRLQSRQRRLSLGELPDTPAHGFEGRSRELLALERLLHQEPYAVIRGQGGVGKTTLASELARWLVRLGRFSRAAFVSLEQHADARSVLDSIGRQLLPEGQSWSVARYSDLKQALQPVERVLADRPTIIVLDNLESLLPDEAGQSPDQAAAAESFDLCRKLLEPSRATRIVFTSRAPLPTLFDSRRNDVQLGPLSTEDAIRLVSEVMKLEGIVPKSDDPGDDPHEVMDLVEAVDRHPRALVLLSREVSRRGVRATTTNLRQLMAELHQKNPGDRENSLYASVELSLRRLPPQMRQQIRVLGVFHGGVSLYLLSLMLGMGKEAVWEIARKLIEVGLATYVGETHLRLDPALPSYLLLEMSKEERSITQAKWADLMEEYAAFLYRERFQHTDVSNKVTLLELPNLLALLDWTIENSTADEVAHLASGLEQLIAPLGRPRVLEKLRQIRERAAQNLTPSDEALFNADCQAIDRLLSRGELHLAYDAARKLMTRLLNAGENAYQGIDYDVAIAQVYVGRIMRMIGNTEAALENLIGAQHRFQLMSGENRVAAQKMQDVVTSEIMICLSETGQVSKAVSLFEEEIKKAERSGDKRSVAVLKNNLGSVYWQQNEYAKALEVISEGKRIFESLGEPGGVAAALHQLGVTYRYTGNYEQAEFAFKQALAIMVREQLSGLEAGTLDELGILYSQMGRLEDGIAFFRRAVGLRSQLQDLRSEGISRGNLGVSLFRLRRYDEARNELHSAIECRTPFGHAAEPWKVWITLHGVEQAAGNIQAAAEARAQAIKSYLAYRRDGGQNVTRGAKLCAQVADAYRRGDTAGVEQTLAQILRTNAPEPFKLLVLKLQNIMQGNLNSEHADDPSLEYTDAAELTLLLESLMSK